MKKIKTIIIDDEQLGRDLIREYLQRHPEITIEAECKDAHEAISAIENFDPDLLFLDIEMPEINGFELLQMLDKIPYIIFSTAYNQYAIKAFEVNAVDYLLKPYTQERFDKALDRVLIQIENNSKKEENIDKLLKHIKSEKKYLKRILVKEADKVIIINSIDICWIEAMEDYVNLHTKNNEFLVNQTLSKLELKLDPEIFVRVHRSYIINFEAVKELQQWTNNRLRCFLNDGNDIVLSRSGTRKLKELLK